MVQWQEAQKYPMKKNYSAINDNKIFFPELLGAPQFPWRDYPFAEQTSYTGP